MSIEVEHKFLMGPNTQKQLHVMGAVLERQWTFRDIYYDTDTSQLMLKDLWLRKRDTAWQLKYPITGEGTSHTDKYHEVENDSDILRYLTSCCELCSMFSSLSSLDELVRNGQLVVVADYSTTRETWSLPTVEGCVQVHVDLDEASFGYSVGEIEVMVEGRGHVTSAEQHSRDIAQLLSEGALEDLPPGGKLSAYLFQNNPSLWQRLMDNNLLRQP